VHVGVEDFGITMVEALASGAPVLAIDRGGALDIVADGVTGILISDARPPSIQAGVQRVRGRSWDPTALSASAQRFSRERFAGELRERLGELASAA
jgi:glycosyltransferase involved in cell wall biosynthesis